MSKTFHIFQLQGLTLWLLSGTDVSHFTWIVLSPWDLVKCKSHFSVFDGIIYYLSFFSNPFDFFENFNIFKVWGQFWLFRADAGWRPLPHISTGYHMRHHSCYHVFKRVLYRFQRTTIISSLLHRSLYALRVIINFF